MQRILKSQKIKFKSSLKKLMNLNWCRGRVARLSSAKAATAVRIRSTPQKKLSVYSEGFSFIGLICSNFSLISSFSFGNNA